MRPIDADELAGNIIAKIRNGDFHGLTGHQAANIIGAMVDDAPTCTGNREEEAKPLETLRDCLVLRLLIFTRREEIPRFVKDVEQQLRDHPSVIILPNIFEPVIVPKGTAIEFQQRPRQ